MQKFADWVKETEEEDGERIDYIAWEILRRRTYDRAYNIVPDNAGATKPLASVSMHEKEDVLTGGRLETRIWRYSKYEIEKRFGLSLLEYLSMPSHLVETLLEIAGQEIAKETPATNKTKQELDKLEREARKR